jgi:mRNA-degrading endonuclease RelE of RelBE toxin-antitoxin system
MSYSVKSIKVFERQSKKLIKKYASLKQELLNLVKQLKQSPHQGIPVGKNCFKSRIAISSKGRGKSGAVPAGFPQQ